MGEVEAKGLARMVLAGRQVVARFDGGTITTDGGGLLLRESEQS
jgi:hypothetical protein